MEYAEVLKNARTCIGPYCKACPVCNGMACRNQIPGPGAKGVGDVAIRNYQKWQEIRVNLDTLCPQQQINTQFDLFGKTFSYPFFAAPIGSVKLHYGDKYTDAAYDAVVAPACAENGIAAFVGDGPAPEMMQGGVAAVKMAGGIGIPTIKPWDMETIWQRLELVKQSGAFAVAMDIDGAGLPFLQNQNPPAGGKSVEQLRQIVEMAGLPFILKGVMTPKAALKARDAGVQTIVVSNHGGRVLDQCRATAEVLPDIVDAVGGSMTILVDGGIRSGTDIFKALALGADAVLLARPFVTAVFGGASEGVAALIHKLGAELEDTMKMCGAASLQDIQKDMIWRP